MNPDTKIIFDAASKPYPRLLFWNCLIAFVLGCLSLLLAKIPWPHSARVMKFFGYFFCISSLVTLGYFSTRWHLDRLRDIRFLSSGSYQAVEGPVENFQPQVPDLSSVESFTVSGHKFAYSDYIESWITTCFNKTTLHNGPIHPGMVLRIKFVDNCILEIERLPEAPPLPNASKSISSVNSPVVPKTNQILEPKLIFDVSSKVFDWSPIKVAAMLFLGGVLAVTFERLTRRGVGIPKIGYFLMALALLFPSYYGIDWHLSRQRHIEALETGRYETVQGPVENFHPMFSEGRKEESFTILNRAFRYSDYRMSNCFDQTSIHGGPVHEGMFLRVDFIDDCILRIEDVSNSRVPQLPSTHLGNAAVSSRARR